MDNYAKTREKITQMVYRELDIIGNEGQLSIDCLPILDKLVDIIKDMEEIDEKESMKENRYEENYSNSARMMPRYYDGNSYGSGNYNISGNYNNGNRPMNGNQWGYSRNNGDDRNIIRQLENLMNDT